MATIQSSVSPLHGSCTIGQPYGNPSSGYKCGWHTGIDFPASGVTGSYDIYSVCTGTVTQAGVVPGLTALGYEVQVREDGTGIYYRFCHMVAGSIAVSVGQQVNTGTKLGVMGDTGNSQGRHLHLEASTTAGWNCNTFLSPGAQLGFGNTRGTVIVYNGSEPGPTPPTPPEPGEDTPTGPFYHRLYNGKWFWSTAPGYTGTLNNSSDLSKKKENAKYIWNYLKKYGWTLESASVVIGAMDLVSTLNSAWKPTTDTESPFGLLGWRYWEFTDWVDAHGEWVADSDYTIIDNSIGRICWFRQYNLGWADETTFTLQAFSESKDTLENLTTAWITNYLYNTLTYNDLLDRAKFWFKYLSKSNKWKYSYMDKTTYNLLT